MGRTRVIESEPYRDLREVLSAADEKLSRNVEKAKTYLQNLTSEVDLEKARAVVAAKNAGLSDYAIGVASGKTSHKSRIAFIEWAFALVEKHEWESDNEVEVLD